MAKRIRTTKQAFLLRVGIRGARAEWALWQSHTREMDREQHLLVLWDRILLAGYASQPLVDEAYRRTATRLRTGQRVKF